ncbi:RNA-directed DNA polymerase, eukaryota [Tanacetum coccineum]
MSIFKVPKSVLNYMESLRRNFFNGFQEGDRKIAWVKWSKVLASKKLEGWAISSFSLSIGSSFQVENKGHIGCLIDEYVYLLLFSSYVRGGVESQQLDQLSLLLDTVILSNMDDRWFWDLNGDGVFQVKDVRSMLDEAFLPKWEIKISSRKNCLLPSLLVPLVITLLEDSSQRVMELYNECGRSQPAKVVGRYWERHRCPVVGRVVVAAVVVKVEAGRAHFSANVTVLFGVLKVGDYKGGSTFWAGRTSYFGEELVRYHDDGVLDAHTYVTVHTALAPVTDQIIMSDKVGDPIHGYVLTDEITLIEFETILSIYQEKPVIADPLGDARSKVQEEIGKEFVAVMASGTICASGAVALATKKVMQIYGHMKAAQS